MLQACPDVSPAKWHLAHSTWFFERFLLRAARPELQAFQSSFDYIFNSYYESSGQFYARPKRGLLSRPSRSEVMRYREYVDRAIIQLFKEEDPSLGSLRASQILEIGIHHEQQHQELLLTDIKYNFFSQALQPAYTEGSCPAGLPAALEPPLKWAPLAEGIYWIGRNRPAQSKIGDFAFDNEFPAHRVYISPVSLALRPISNREYLGFVEEGAYSRVQLWLSEGWAWLKSEGIQQPLYWKKDPADGWLEFTLQGWQTLDLDRPVCHLSYYEAEAFARWAGARLPSEAEWEVFAKSQLKNEEARGQAQVWEWTKSSYSPYPAYQAWEGSLGEYNGKFMVNQYVLRGGSCATPVGHMRLTYRNFFPASARWQFTGVRLAKDI